MTKKSRHKPIKVKVGMRVTNAPMAGLWGTVLEIIDRRKTAKTVSEKLKAKNSPLSYIVQWDNGRTENVRHKILWFSGDDPGFGRPILKDPKNMKSKSRKNPAHFISSQFQKKRVAEVFEKPAQSFSKMLNDADVYVAVDTHGQVIKFGVPKNQADKETLKKASSKIRAAVEKTLSSSKYTTHFRIHEVLIENWRIRNQPAWNVVFRYDDSSDPRSPYFKRNPIADNDIQECLEALAYLSYHPHHSENYDEHIISALIDEKLYDVDRGVTEKGKAFLRDAGSDDSDM